MRNINRRRYVSASQGVLQVQPANQLYCERVTFPVKRSIKSCCTRGATVAAGSTLDGERALECHISTRVVRSSRGLPANGAAFQFDQHRSTDLRDFDRYFGLKRCVERAGRRTLLRYRRPACLVFKMQAAFLFDVSIEGGGSGVACPVCGRREDTRGQRGYPGRGSKVAPYRHCSSSLCHCIGDWPKYSDGSNKVKRARERKK